MDSVISKSYDTITFNLRTAGYTFDEIPKDMEFPSFIATHSDKTRIHVLYHIERLAKNSLDNIVLNIPDKRDTDIIYIVVGSQSLDTLRGQLKADKIQLPYIIITNLWALQFRILEHNYVPKHIILTDAEVIKFKNGFNITNNSQIPEISRFDPVAQSIFMKPDQICKIMRNEKATMDETFYRVCI